MHHCLIKDCICFVLGMHTFEPDFNVANFESIIGKSCFWLVSQVIIKLEHIGD